MQAQEIIDDVLAIFGDRAGIQVTQEDVVRWINDAQLMIARRTNCLSRTTTPVIIAGTSNYDLPGDFLKFERVTYDGNPLMYTQRAMMDEIFAGRDVPPVGRSIPTRYFLRSGSIYLFMVPESVGALSIEYSARPAVILDPGDTPEIDEQFHADIKQLCLARCYELDENWEMAGAKDGKFDKLSYEAIDDVRNPLADTYPSIRLLGDDIY